MDFAAYLGEFQRFPEHRARTHAGPRAASGDAGHGLQVVHVAGTNGKGSLCAYLDAVLEVGGYRVEVSPELLRVNRRMPSSGGEIGTGELNALTGKDSAAAVMRLKLEAPSRFGSPPPPRCCIFRHPAATSSCWKRG